MVARETRDGQTCKFSASSRSNDKKPFPLSFVGLVDLNQFGWQLLKSPCKTNNNSSKRLSLDESVKEAEAASAEESDSLLVKELCKGVKDGSVSSCTTLFPRRRNITEASPCLMFRADGSLRYPRCYNQLVTLSANLFFHVICKLFYSVKITPFSI